MRRFLLLILLAGAAGPALAAGSDDDEDRGLRVHRGQHAQSDDTSHREQAPAVRPHRNVEPRDNGNRPTFGGAGSGESNSARVEPVRRGAAGDSVRSWRQDSDAGVEQRVRKADHHPTFPDRPEIERRRQVSEPGDTVRNWRRVDREGGDSTIEDRNIRTAPNVREGSLVQPRRPLPRVFEPAERRVSRTPIPGTAPPAPRTAGAFEARPAQRWNTDWRRDRHYDWRDWRRRHRSRFHFGFYYDPFGWDYFRYGIGWRLWPSYYRSSYWLNDPSYYRLPRAYGPYRWVRYHNDALLVNIYSGQVVDVIYDFFW